MKKQQPTATEQVLTDYVIENANLKLKIKKLEKTISELREEDDNVESIQKD